MSQNIEYMRTLSNARDLWVKPGHILVEDKPPEEGGRPITDDELALVDKVRRLKGWREFGISQRGGFAWTKENSGPGSWPCDNHLWFDSLAFNAA